MKNLEKRKEVIKYSIKLNTTNLSPLRSGNISVRSIENSNAASHIGSSNNTTVATFTTTGTTTGTENIDSSLVVSSLASTHTLATGTYNNVRLYEGTYLSTSWIVDQNDLDQRFIIPNTGLDLDTLIIKVQPDSGSTIQECSV